jgi:hypothetical protein
VKALILLVLLIPTSLKACSPPRDGSHFTCPSHDFLKEKLIKKQPIKEPIYKNTFGWKAQALIKKLKDYELEQNKQLVEKMINKALVEYENGNT